MREDQVKCDKCELPVGRIVGDTLVVENRHHGQKHTTVISLREILARMLSVTVDKEK